MTIQEAIKSGKPFRRKAWAKVYPRTWYTKRATKRYETWRIGVLWENLTYEGTVCLMRDILATDWEVKSVSEGKGQ